MATLSPPRTLPAYIQRERSLRPDLMLVLPFLALSALGIIMVYTASAPRLEALGLDPAREMRRQAIFVVIGVGVFFLASLIDGRRLRWLSPVVYLGALSLLVLVLVVGAERSGAQRWLQLGPFQLQPSELAKVAVIMSLATILAGAPEEAMRWLRVARAVAAVALPAVLIFLQPDLGTMLVFGFIAVAMLFIAGATWRQLGFLVIASLVGSVGLFRLGAIKEYQITRLTAFLDQTSDLANANYNQLQSEIAIGSGGFFGKGLGQGAQTNLSFVPAQSTDFIFTAIGEQLGFVGGIIVLVLFAVVVWRVLVAAATSRDRFGQLVATGVAALLVFHVFVNVGMTMRLMPVTGLPLPWISAGGTAFLAMSFALGLAHSVWMRRSPVPGERQIL
jgi:rod shape determining protein RodA